MNYEDLQVTDDYIQEISKYIEIKDIIKEINSNRKDYEKYVLETSKSKLLYVFYNFTPNSVKVDFVGCKDE